MTRRQKLIAWILDDTGFPKKRIDSVGVTRQNCGQVGEQDKCRIAVSVSLATEQDSLPVRYQLYLPENWAGDSCFPKDTRHLPSREWLCLAADFTMRRILSCVLQEQKASILRGYWRIVGYYLQIQRDLRLFGGPSRERTILHCRIPSRNPIWVQTGLISH